MKNIIKLTLLIIIFFTQNSVNAGKVVLDHVSGTWFDGSEYKVIPNNRINFYIRLINDDDQQVSSISHGFRVSGPTFFIPTTGSSTLNPGSFPFLTISKFSSNGFGADTVGFNTGLYGKLPVGYNDIAFIISTGNVAEGEIICIDSCFFPPSGVWKWSGSISGDIFPSWDGPHCFISEVPCDPPQFTKCGPTNGNPILIYNQLTTTSYQAENEVLDNSLIRYAILEGPGAIDAMTGEWSYTPDQNDIDTTVTLSVITYNTTCPNLHDTCSTMVTFVLNYTYCDFNEDGLGDISDLVLITEFLFANGTPPTPYYSADLNFDKNIDITDLVYTVQYIFGS